MFDGTGKSVASNRKTIAGEFGKADGERPVV